jgi:hypothetical protein
MPLPDDLAQFCRCSVKFGAWGNVRFESKADIAFGPCHVRSPGLRSTLPAPQRNSDKPSTMRLAITTATAIKNVHLIWW